VTSIWWVALGGAIGAASRYLVSSATAERLGQAFPFGTLIVNVGGSLLLGLVGGLLARGAHVPDSVRLLVGVGFCGAFTTFSTFALEAIGLANRPSLSSALMHVAVTNMLCLFAAFLGLRLAGT
jgi:CrcB protein